MDVLTANKMRRQWPMAAALGLLVVFMLVHTFVFQPLAERYRHALAQASALGIVLDPSRPSQQSVIPVRVFGVLMANSLAPEEANARLQSGTLGPEMTQALTAACAHHGLEVVVAEPGVVSQATGSIEVRAHLKMRGSYASFVAWMDELARGDRLWVIERFVILPAEGGRKDIEVWMGSCLLKRNRGRS